MKKLLSFVLLLTILLSALVLSSCNNHKFQGFGTEFILNSDKASYTLSYMYLGKKGDVVIPSEYNGLPITRIRKNVFWNEHYVENLTIPATVTHINDYAFENCINLEKVTFESGSQLEDINNCAFADCYSLREIELPENVEHIGGNAFRNCTSLESVHIPKGVSNLNGAAFSGCSSLNSITIDEENETYKKVGNFIYELKNDAKHLAMCLGADENGDLFLPEDIDEINSGAFTLCKNADTVYLHEGFDEIPRIECAKAYVVAEDNPNFCSVDGVVYKKDMSYLVHYPQSKEDKTFTLPSQVIGIDGGLFGATAFMNVKYLENLIIPEGVKYIGDRAFWGSNIKYVELPKSIENVGFKAFYDCSSLKEIKYAGTRREFGLLMDLMWVNCWETPILKAVCSNGTKYVWLGIV